MTETSSSNPSLKPSCARCWPGLRPRTLSPGTAPPRGPQTSPTVLLVDVDLYCTEEGDGPPLLVHHGGPGLDHTVIAPHLSPLAQDVRLVCFDHRGTGRSAAPQGPDPFTIH